MIVIVSDLHIGGSEAPFFNKRGFTHFVDSVLKARESEITHFIMLGDVLDFWWKPTHDVAKESSEIMFELIELDMKKYYLFGNHDFEIKNIYPLEIDFEIVEGLSSKNSSAIDGFVFDADLRSGNRNFKYVHGHQISYWNTLPFYEMFCQAMCGRMDNDPTANVWDMLFK